MKKHIFSIVFFIIVMFVFLGKVVFMKAGFIDGDYLVQFYPWSKIYSEAIKNFSFPFWTKYFNSGFPLMAEGQIGGFYPINIILFFFLPFKAAYNYSFVLHFVLAGIFTYIYARKIGCDELGGALAGFLFCFGSAYAGCFYNLITLRTLIWFPLALFFMEKYFNKKKLKYLIYCGIILGIQLLAGFVQMALYSLFFYLIYFIYGLASRARFNWGDFLKFGFLSIIALIIFYPQFILSSPLMHLSGRASASLGFALWGSFSPFNLISLCFPYSVFYGTKFYIGMLPIFFMILAIVNFKKEKCVQPLVILLLFSIFLASGSYNPFYVLLIKMTRLYGFRNPSKIIFFGVFAASILSGWGFTRFFTAPTNIENKKSIRIFSIFLITALGLFFISKIILYVFKNSIIRIAQQYVLHYIAGKEYHRYSLERYLEAINNFYHQLVSSSSLTNIFVVASLFLCITALIINEFILKKKSFKPFYRLFFLALIFLDIFIFSFYGTGFRGNIKDFTYLNPPQGKIIDILKADKGVFRILPFDLTDSRLPWWAIPNANILVGLDSVASYTPLAGKKYKEELLPLEVVDDSLGLLSPLGDSLVKEHRTLRLLNVKYLVTSRRLDLNFLENIISENGVFLYKIKDSLPRLFFTSNIDGDIVAEQPGLINAIEYKDGFAKIEIITDKEGFLVLSENYFPGWEVLVDNIKADLLFVKNLVQAVHIDTGKHTVVFKYEPI